MAEYTLNDLFDEYVSQRQQNVRTDQALQLLMQMKPDLTIEQRRELSQWIREWEVDRGKRTTAIEVEEETRPMNTPERSTRVVVDEIVCPHCMKRNPMGSKYCYSCGELLTGGIPAATDRLYEEVDDPASFGNFSTLIIAVRGYDQQPVRLKIGEEALIIGRSDPESSVQPDIDLAPYDAKSFGVSRQHAILQRTQNTLTLSDQGSVNNTYINGEKIHPHEVRVVRDGDEVRFGRLATRFTFTRELRRLLG